MGEKKYDEALGKRVDDLRAGLGPQPLATLWAIVPDLRKQEAKLRRVLSRKVFAGDADVVVLMEKAKAALMAARANA